MASKGAQSRAKGGPKYPKGGKKDPKSLLLGAQRVTFGRQIGESGPLRKHQYGLCFHHIMRVRAPPFSHPKSPRERTVHRDRSFSHFWLHFWRPSGPKDAPREPKGAKRSPKASPGIPKKHKKIDLGPYLGARGAREAPGVPPGGNLTQNRLKNITSSPPLGMKKLARVTPFEAHTRN